MGTIYYLMGKSASGKDKIYGRIAGELAGLLRPLVLYTTRPIRKGEVSGREYFFVDEEAFRRFQKEGKVIEARSYQTVHGIWSYFTADDGQVDLDKGSYLGIGTLESYRRLKEYFGEKALCPIYIEVEDGERLFRALIRERKQEHPRYAELCRRFLADCEDFSREKLREAGISRKFENVDLEACVGGILQFIREKEGGKTG